MRKFILTLFGLLAFGALWAQDVPITEVEGESFTYTREGQCLYPKKYGEDNYIYEGNQGGAMTVVFGANNEVYFQDPVYGFVHETFVKGTLSEDGKTITVPVPQVLYTYRFAGGNTETVVLAVGKFSDETKEYKIDKDVKEVTYSVSGDKETLTLVSLDKMAPLGNFWSADSTFAGRGEWETVLTKYVEITEVVEVTEEEEKQMELTTVKHPLGGAFWATADADDYQFVVDTIKVATLGEAKDTVMVQGMIPELPEAWARGVKKNGTVTFPVQLLYVDGDKKYFLAGLSGDGMSMSPFVMTYDEALNSYTSESRLIVNNSDLRYNENTIQYYYTGVYVGKRPALVELPASVLPSSIQVMPYEGTLDDGQDKVPFAGTLNVAISGEDVYVQGLIPSAPKGWLKGKFDNMQENVFFNIGQYVGYDAYGNIFAVGDKLDRKDVLTPLVESVDDPADIRLSYDENAKSFKLMNNLYGSRKSGDINRDYVVKAGLTINEGDFWVAANQGYENATAVTEAAIAAGVKAVFDKAENKSNAPKYYNLGTAVRMYAGNTLKISSEDKVIGKIAFVFDMDKEPMLETKDGNLFFFADSIGVWVGDANEVTFNVINTTGNQARIKSIMVFYFDYSTSTVTLPDFAKVEPYKMKATTQVLFSPEEKTVDVNVGFYGNEVYFQGLSENVPDAWVKGKLADGKVTVPKWYMGTFLKWDMFSTELVFGGAEFAYDSETGAFTAASYTVVNPNESDEDWAKEEEFSDVVISKQAEVAATPANPSITDFVGSGVDRYVAIKVPTFDKDSTTLFTSKLSYVLFVEKKDGNVDQLTLTKELYNFDVDLSEIPYEFTDDVYIHRKRVALLQTDEELQSWTNIGIQSIYRGAGEEHKSDVSWYNLQEYWIATGITTVATESEAVEYFDLQGRKTDALSKGLFIKQIRMNDGTIKTIKVLRR